MRQLALILAVSLLAGALTACGGVEPAHGPPSYGNPSGGGGA